MLDALPLWEEMEKEDKASALYEKNLEKSKFYNRHFVNAFEKMVKEDPSTPIGRAKEMIEESWRLKNPPKPPSVTTTDVPAFNFEDVAKTFEDGSDAWNK